MTGLPPSGLEKEVAQFAFFGVVAGESGHLSVAFLRTDVRPETDRPAKSKATDEVHAKNLEILQKLQQLFPAGEGRQHVDSLQAGLLDYVQAMDRIRGLVEKDFPAAMKILDPGSSPRCNH